MAALLLVRYGELALKSPPVRREFESALRRNILDQFVHDGLAGRIRSDRGHLYVETEDGTRAAGLLRRVFGVTSVSIVEEVSSEPEVITARLLELGEARLTARSRFAVRARRTGQHSFTSQELAGNLGGAILDRFADRDLTVDLEHPDVELFVEVRGPRTYLYFDRFAGPGGLPMGVAGRLVALVDGLRGALGAFLMMKRGCRLTLVVPVNGDSSLTDALTRFDPNARVLRSDGSDWVGLIARMAEESHADGIVLPIPVEEYSNVRTLWGDRVVFSPTVGLSDAEVEDRWRNAAALVS